MRHMLRVGYAAYCVREHIQEERQRELDELDETRRIGREMLGKADDHLGEFAHLSSDVETNVAIVSQDVSQATGFAEGSFGHRREFRRRMGLSAARMHQMGATYEHCIDVLVGILSIQRMREAGVQ